MGLINDYSGREIEEEKELAVKKDPLVDELYFATFTRDKKANFEYDQGKSMIWRLTGKGSAELISIREGKIKAMCSHNGKLYGVGFHYMFEIQKNRIKDISKDLSHWNKKVLCSHDGKLYSRHHNYHLEFSDDLKSCKQITAYRNERSVLALCSHDGRLYDGGQKHCIYEMSKMDLTSKVIVYRISLITALCSHEKRLYSAEAIKDSYVFEFSNNFKTTKEITTRSKQINALCSHDGRLLDAGDYGKIYDTSIDDIIYECDEEITAMCSHRWKE